MFKYDEDEANKEVTITITKGELARAYAVISAVWCNKLSDNIYYIAQKTLDQHGNAVEFLRTISPKERFDYLRYEKEWLSILFPVVDEKTQKINELEQIINDAKAKIKELKS